MKTASELKIFKANGYEYIYIYYKQNCLIRINTKYTFVKNGMTKENLYKNTVPDYKNKNEHISLLKKRTDKYISDHLLSSSQSGKINQKEAYNAAFNLNPTYIDHAGNKLLLPIYNTFVSDLNKEKHYQPKTIIYYNNLKNHIEEYEKDVIKHKLTLSDFNTKTSLIDFCNFLGEKRGMNDNSIAKRLVTLKSFLNYCIGEGIYNYDATVFSYKIQKYETDVVALNLDELQNLIYLKNDNPSWQKIIDVFVCNCFMGLRISDLSRLSKADFSMDEDGDYKYTSKNKKTGTTVMIPIIEIPLTILKKYDFNLPSYTGQYFNRQLQKILTHYKLFEDEIITRREVFKKETESKVMKRTKITSHTCRKSFITFCIMSQIPLNVIMKASGHKQIQTMQAYVLKTPDKEQFKKLNKKTREVMKDERLKREREQVEIENLKDPTHSL